jgi:hypothetical protein
VVNRPRWRNARHADRVLAGPDWEEFHGNQDRRDSSEVYGDGPALTDSDIVEPSIVTEDLFGYTSLGPTPGSTIRKLADLKPKVLAAMHGTSYSGDGAAALRALGDHYDARLRARPKQAVDGALQVWLGMATYCP